jgi:hypothetical protein
MYTSMPTFPQKYPTEDIVRQSVPKRSYGIYGPHPLWRRALGGRHGRGTAASCRAARLYAPA